MWWSGPDTDKTSMNKRINLEDYVPSGEGGTAVTYKHKSRNSLAKLYNPGFLLSKTS